MKLVLSILVVASLLLGSCFVGDADAAAAAPAPVPIPTSTPSSCNDMCNARCSKAGIPKRCFKYCCICCSKCNCVPSGTYGNKSECPCYRDMLNAKGKPRCP